MYCTKCGKKLEDGEVCTCTQTGAAPQMRPVQHTQQPVQPEKADQNIQAEHYTSQSTQQPRQNSQSTQQPGQSSQSARKTQHTQSGSGAQQPRYTQQPQYTGQGQSSQQSRYTQQAQYTRQGQPGQNPQSAPRSVDTEKMKEKGTEILAMLKEMALDAVDVLKRPVSKSELMAAEGSVKPGLRLLIAKCVIFLIMIMILFMRLNSELDGILGLPYASAIILTLLLTVGLDSLEAWLLKVLSGAFKCETSVNAMFSVVGVKAVFGTVITVISAILMMASQGLGIAVFLAASLVVPFAEFASYRSVTDGDENKKVFAFAIVKICVIIAALLVTYLLGKDMISSLQGSSTYYGMY